ERTPTSCCHCKLQNVDEAPAPVIVADVFETGSGIPATLERLGARVVLEPLAAGDYRISGGVLVERKTVQTSTARSARAGSGPRSAASETPRLCRISSSRERTSTRVPAIRTRSEAACSRSPISASPWFSLAIPPIPRHGCIGSLFGRTAAAAPLRRA